MNETTTPVPRLDELKAEQRSALEAGRLTFQRCRSCGNAWLPTREECPRCLAADFEWEDASGRAKLVSWCVYHRTPLPEFAHRVPYTVFIVELAEGPRLIGSPASDNAGEPAIERALELVIEHEGDLPVARFRYV
jgi:uncharacterized OB-fold protein